MKARDGLDDGVAHYVNVLREGGIETCQSCEGGPGHCYEVPTVDFRGDCAEGPRAVGVALQRGLPVAELRRVWSIWNNEMDGPIWSMTFKMKATEFLKRDAAKSKAYHASKKTGRTLP